jgi:DNA-binding MurR/RpiR family transcriptional regulator
LAAVLVDYLEYQVSLLGLPVFAATSTGRVMHLVRSLNKQDLAIAISFRRGLRQTVEGVQQARSRGAYCVGIADTYLSPLARECDEIFLASVESPSFGASYVAPVALVNSLIAAIGQYRRAQTMVIVKEIAEEQRKGFRWYNM